MSFFHSLFSFFNRVHPFAVAHAHCDVPCGLYSPDAAMMAARTVAKMVEKINALTQDPTPENRNSFVRMVATKEEHAQLCKKELLILWTDYFKPEHLAMFPSLHETFWNAAKLCSKNKQHIDAAAAQELLGAVGEVAGMFEKAEAEKQK